MFPLNMVETLVLFEEGDFFFPLRVDVSIENSGFVHRKWSIFPLKMMDLSISMWIYQEGTGLTQDMGPPFLESLSWWTWKNSKFIVVYRTPNCSFHGVDTPSNIPSTGAPLGRTLQLCYFQGTMGCFNTHGHSCLGWFRVSQIKERLLLRFQLIFGVWDSG